MGTQVVKANPITPSTPASSVSGSAASSITAAADKLSAAAYPFIKDVDWTSDLYSKPIPGADPQKVNKAIGKMITMGAAMDGASLKEAANAHAKAKVTGDTGVVNKLYSTVNPADAQAAYNALL